MGWLTLGSTTLTFISDQLDLGIPDEASNRRVMTIPLLIQASNADDVVTSMRAISDELRKAKQAAHAIAYGAPVTLTIQVENVPVTFDVLPGNDGECGSLTMPSSAVALLLQGTLNGVVLTLVTSAYGRGERLTATNLILNSTDPTASGFTATNLTVTANAATAPNGATVAATLRETTTNGVHSLSHQITKAASSLDYAFPVYLQAAGTHLRRPDAASQRR